MPSLTPNFRSLGAALACCALLIASPSAAQEADPPRATTSPLSLLAPPQGERPVVVQVRFDLRDLNEIDDSAETFEFTGVLVLEWRDPRQAFDPAEAGVEEKVFQGDYQVDELSTGWFPQVVLVNESGLYEKSGVLLRVRPDGTSTLIQTLNAVAESEFDLHRFPLDAHRLEAVFEVLGFDAGEVVLEAPSPSARVGEFQVSQWEVGEVSLSIRERATPYAVRGGDVSAFVVSVDVRRESFYTTRLLVFPLVVIVLLSFSVFWMHRSSLGDRLSVSFIGILTGVAYQIVMSDQLPRISYVTLMHGFLNLSFLTMCATVVVNLVVGTLDQRGQGELGDRIDRRCRWAFPLGYLVVMLALVVAAVGIY